MTRRCLARGHVDLAKSRICLASDPISKCQWSPCVGARASYPAVFRFSRTAGTPSHDTKQVSAKIWWSSYLLQPTNVS